MQQLVGKSHTFPDGNRLEITQIKRRSADEYGEEMYVTFNAYSGPGIPRKQVMALNEFQTTYGHLFLVE